MKIALIGPLDSPISKNSVGGSEIWTYNYGTELIKNQLAEVDLYGLKESEFDGNVLSVCGFNDVKDGSGKASGELINIKAAELAEKVLDNEDEYDLIHISAFSFLSMMPILSKSKKPIVVTLHGSGWDAARSEEVFLKYSEPTYIFASDYALKKYSQPAKFEVIHHGIDVDSFTYSAKKDDYLFWMSRINSNKGVTDAIAIANKLKKNLIIAGPIADQAFFDNVVKQSLSDSIRFVGPLDFEKKNQYYSKASAFLFPVNQAEPFGLVCLEALACGTPVVASRLGALPEIIEDGVNGYLVDSGNIEKFCEKINEIEKIDKSTCRESVQEEFSLNKMMNRYFSLYKKIFGNNT